MRLCREVECRVEGFDHQAFDGLAAHDVLRDDFQSVGFGFKPIPNAFRINHRNGSVVAAIQAAGFIGTHGFFQASGFEFGFEKFLNMLAVVFAARLVVGAGENVMGILHGSVEKEKLMENQMNQNTRKPFRWHAN